MNERSESKISLRPEEARELLPWFRTGRLPHEEDEAIAALLAGSADLRRQLEEIHRQRSSTADHPTGQTEIKPSGNAWAGVELGRLLHGLEHARQRHAAPDIGPVRGSKRPLFSRGPILALSLLTVLFAMALLATDFYRQHAFPIPPYLRAYVPNFLENFLSRTLDEGNLRVTFLPGATWSEIDELLRQMQARIVSGPESDGSYILDLADQIDFTATVRLLDARADLVRVVARHP